ncbi:Fic family protein [Desulfobacter latus]|uniref:Fic family protein n=1 Tax=Desulfobacter latus TaxID=2292 RepID=A0A850TEL4_9BACT|nr:Fic family protein [Desulfobacter latus]NWH06727.1 Fic family protein [Desulfobacter latus]
MKVPVTPPDYFKIINQGDGPDFLTYLKTCNAVDEKGRYLHWDKLRHHAPPEGLTVEQWWAGIKLIRLNQSKKLNFESKDGISFNFTKTDEIEEQTHWLDKNAAGTIKSSFPIDAKSGMKKEYIIKSLIREATTSSQIEGATTTREVAKEMILQDRAPKNHSEQMIYNNYHAMEFILENKSEPLTLSMVLELHKILTTNTLKDEKKAGVFRTVKDADIYVADEVTNKVLHLPPGAKGIEKRIERLCRFANGQGNGFIHPVLKAIILHFMLAYEHPFIDGNGRTARALFYWAMINEGYWLTEFISISQVIKRSQTQYAKAFLYTETDSNDLTYFILHQLDVIKKAISELHEYLSERTQRIQEAQELLLGATLKKELNLRQLSLLHHALANPNFIYNINQYKRNYAIAYDTARKDLLQMSDEFSFLRKLKDGKTLVFLAPADLKERIEKMKKI